MIDEVTITSGWEGQQCMVSICCVTYNHEKFIRQALDSLLNQKTTFPFEILIHDDASPDSTADIIREYEAKYPQIVKPICQTENQRSKLKMGMNPRFNFPRAEGKYIALCEGDDFWIDPLKLQKQVDFLEANPDYNICFHNAEVYEEDKPTSKLVYKADRKQVIQLEDLLRGDFTKNCCSMFRYSKGMFDGRMEMLQDTTIFMICLENDKKAYYLDEVMAVYRVHAGGVWGLMSSLKKKISAFRIYVHLFKTYPQETHTRIIQQKLGYLATEVFFYEFA